MTFTFGARMIRGCWVCYERHNQKENNMLQVSLVELSVYKLENNTQSN